MHEKILIVEDELIVAGVIKLTLEEADYEVVGIARSVNKALEIIDEKKPFLVLVDIYLKGNLTGINLATELHKRGIPFIFLSANCNKEILDAANVTQPYGFIVKPFRSKDLFVNLNIARYRHEQQVRFNSDASKTFLKPGNVETPPKKSANVFNENVDVGFEGIIGKSALMLSVFHLIKQVASTNTSVLILGESGTGKECIADAIYNLSLRKGKPFIKVNCAALPANLIESELFGHEKGAFTGAMDKRIGKFEQADGGTIFLDEIGEMPLDMQVKLLRVLQEREIERIGGRGTVKTDVRFIAATNRNLEKEIAQGRFRLDLYYRLHVFPIEVPALREHKEDIPLLLSHFIQISSKQLQKRVDAVSDTVMQKLLDYAWPGNVRELQNIIERSVVLSEQNILEEIKLPIAADKASSQNNAGMYAVKTIAELERDYILEVLTKCNQRISGPGGAAELLRLPASTLASKMKRLGILKKHTI